MATAKKMIWQALQKRCTRLRRSRNGIFFVSVDLLIHSEQYANTSMAVLIKRVTCKSSFFFFLGTKKSFKLRNLPSRPSTLFLSRRSACPFLNCDQVSSRFTEYSRKLTFHTLCSRKVRYWEEIYVLITSLAVKCKSEENCAFDDKSTIFGTEIIEILRNIFWYRAIPD